ncbi:hypothetical protein AMK24_29965 [Streptomyces sp. CB02366]|nr:hypothetical protein AMK24_29965 [Streptomyces sp. CB02366]
MTGWVYESDAYLFNSHSSVQQPLFRFRYLHGLREEFVKLEDLNTSSAQLGDEVRVVPLSSLDPHRVVE